MQDLKGGAASHGGPPTALLELCLSRAMFSVPRLTCVRPSGMQDPDRKSSEGPGQLVYIPTEI